MNCPQCNASNEADAAFCTECGKSFNAEAKTSSATSRRTYLFMFVLVPILALVTGLGYYKFFLPDGVAAVVNGEEIKLSELDSAVANVQGKNEEPGRLRHQLLNQMISERIVLQEARKAGITVSKQEIESSLDSARASSGLDDGAFRKKMSLQYGSMSTFEEALSQRVLINKFIADKVVPPGADPQAARVATDQWYDGVSRKAAVRIALAEQGAGCGECAKEATGQTPCRQGTQGPCCAKGAKADAGGCNRPSQKPAASGQIRSAEDACLQYWHAKHGPDAVIARSRDFGCHVQVDIVKDNKIIGSLKYQNGSILEL